MPFLKNYIESQDWIAKWYIVAKERGSNTTALIATKNAKTNEVKEYPFCHSLHDGMGFMLDYFEKNNIQLATNLNAKFKEKVSFWKNFFKVYKGLTQVQVNKINWRNFDVNAHKEITPKLEIIYFSEEETKALHEYLNKNKISENAYILSIVNNLLLPKLKHQEGEGKWLIPINMRGNISRQNEKQNISSGIYISTPNQVTPSIIKEKIKAGFQNKEHWINWWTFHVSLLLSKKFMAKISLKSSQNSFFYGSFTNMGRWNHEQFVDSNKIKDLYFYVAPPGTPNYPIGLGAMTWFNKLSLTLKVHPSILKNQEEIQVLSSEIKAEILNFKLKC